MKNSSKGFIVPLLITAVALLIIGGGVYFYETNKTQTLNPAEQVNTHKVSMTSTTTIYVVSPKDGEMVDEGSDYIITWQAKRLNYPFVAVSLQESSGMCEHLVHDGGGNCIRGIPVANTGSYTFHIPYDLSPGNYRFYLEACSSMDNCPPFWMAEVPRGLSSIFNIVLPSLKSTTRITKDKWGVSFLVNPDWQIAANVDNEVDMIGTSSQLKEGRMSISYYNGPGVDIPYGASYYWNDKCGGWCTYAPVSSINSVVSKAIPKFYISNNIPVFLDITKNITYIIPLSHSSFIEVQSNSSRNTQTMIDLVKSIVFLSNIKVN